MMKFCASTSVDDHFRVGIMDGERIERGDTVMFPVGFGLHHGCHGKRQFFGCVIPIWCITHLIDEKVQCGGIF